MPLRRIASITTAGDANPEQVLFYDDTQDQIVRKDTATGAEQARIGGPTVSNRSGSLIAGAGGTLANALSLTNQDNNIATVATAGDSVVMANATIKGERRLIENTATANSLDLFPQSGKDIGLGADTAMPIPVGVIIEFRAEDTAGTWYPINSYHRKGAPYGKGPAYAKGTATSSTPTIHSTSGVITTASLSTAAGAQDDITLTNSIIDADSEIIAVLQTYGGNGTPIIDKANVTADNTAVISVRNVHATTALNAAVTIVFLVMQT